MLSIFASIVPSGAELVFSLALVLIMFTHISDRKNGWVLLLGATGGMFAAVALYLVQIFIADIDLLDLIQKSILVFSFLCVFSWLPFQIRNRHGFGSHFLIFVLAFAMTMDILKNILLSSMPILSLVDGFSTIWVLKLIGAILSVLLLIFLSSCLMKTRILVSAKMITVFTLLCFVDLFFRSVVELVQLLLGMQVIPLTMWELDLMGPIVDHKNLFLDLSLSLILFFLVVLAVIIPKYLRENGRNLANSAQRRKFIAGKRRVRNWFVGFASTLTILATILSLNGFMSAGQLGKPPIPVTAQNGQVEIATSNLEKGELNIYSYQLQDGTDIRFLVLRKTGQNFGIGLDACQNCGDAGYYQEGNQIICKKCGSVVNPVSIGYKGGCNPLPLTFQVTNQGVIVISTSELGKSESIFA